MKKVKYGVIGTGMIAQVHADAIRNNENSELVIVYDKIIEKAASFAEKNNCSYATNFDDFLASDIDAVTIATPSGYHGGVAIAAANAKKHILCEKPLEVTVKKTNEMLHACAYNKVILAAVFQSRFARNVQLIKKAIDEGRFGKPVLANASLRWFRTKEYYSNGLWRGTWALDGGGALMNQGIHNVDLLLYFNGEVEEVNGRMTRIMHKQIEVEDTVVSLLKFKNGSLGLIEASTACAPGFPRKIELSGTKGSVILEDDKIIRWKFVDETQEDEIIRQTGGVSEGLEGGSSTPEIHFEGHKRQVADLSNAILNGTELMSSGVEGRRVVDVICAVYESARNGTNIKLL